MKSITKILVSLVLVVFLSTLILPVSNYVYGAENYSEDGLYSVPITKNIAMGGSNFSDNVALEKRGESYFMTFTILKNEKFKDLTLKSQGQLTNTVIDGEKTRYTYKLAKEQLYSEIKFSVYIIKMGMTKEFGIVLHNDEAEKVENVDDAIPQKNNFVWLYIAIVAVIIIAVVAAVLLIKRKHKKLNKNNNL